MTVYTPSDSQGNARGSRGMVYNGTVQNQSDTGNHNPRVGGSSPSSATKICHSSDGAQGRFTDECKPLTRDGTPRKRVYKANRRAAVYEIDRTCTHCGTAFVATKNPAQKHCSTECRLWSWVDVRGRYDCWEWTGAVNGDGYGGLRIDGKFYPAHRLALILQTKQDPADLFALHACDNPPCCNPRHLRWGTPADNAQDAINRGRRYRGRAK